MIPTKCEFLHEPDKGIWGDCYRAAIASILERPLSHVPHFGEGGPDSEVFNTRVEDWLLANNFGRVSVAYTHEGLSPTEHLKLIAENRPVNRHTHFMFCGTSALGVGHVVVAKGDKIVHDPSLVNSGIVGPYGDHYWYEYLVELR